MKTPVAGSVGLCQSHAWLEQAFGLIYGCVDGSVLGLKLAEFEQVAAARRAKSSRENPLQRGAKRETAPGQILLLCASNEAVGPAAAEAAAECRSMNQ